ncbi:MAG: elongation factor P [Gemmatimonadota bacterium]|nr:MAG: elongation factor P [Gemmatimonadota bacterium]
MATSNDFRNGMALNLDGKLVTIVDFQHVKPGKGGAFVRSKLKDVVTGAVVEKTWRGGEKVEEVRLEKTPMQFLYREGDFFHVMHQETFDQITLPEELFGDQALFLKENEVLVVLLHGEKPVTVEIPNFVELEVTATEPGFKGNTAQGATKPATLETGAVVQVPLFVNSGEILKIDTRKKAYVERVKR